MGSTDRVIDKGEGLVLSELDCSVKTMIQIVRLPSTTTARIRFEIAMISRPTYLLA